MGRVKRGVDSAREVAALRSIFGELLPRDVVDNAYYSTSKLDYDLAYAILQSIVTQEPTHQQPSTDAFTTPTAAMEFIRTTFPSANFAEVESQMAAGIDVRKIVESLLTLQASAQEDHGESGSEAQASAVHALCAQFEGLSASDATSELESTNWDLTQSSVNLTSKMGFRNSDADQLASQHASVLADHSRAAVQLAELFPFVSANRIASVLDDTQFVVDAAVRVLASESQVTTVSPLRASTSTSTTTTPFVQQPRAANAVAPPVSSVRTASLPLASVTSSALSASAPAFGMPPTIPRTAASGGQKTPYVSSADDPIELLCAAFPEIARNTVELVFQMSNSSLEKAVENLETSLGSRETLTAVRKPVLGGKQRLTLSAEPAELPSQWSTTSSQSLTSTMKARGLQDDFAQLDKAVVDNVLRSCGGDVTAARKSLHAIARDTPTVKPVLTTAPRSTSQPHVAAANVDEADIPQVSRPLGSLYAAARREAAEHALMRNFFYREAARAFVGGSGAVAKQLAARGHFHNAEMHRAHQQGGHEIFTQRNALVGEDSIDLHGLHVQEALEMLRLRIQEQRRRGVKQLFVITGAGKHSLAGTARVKSAVIRFCREERIRYREPQSGGLMLSL
eukprot:TRINITY_DN8173_c0_g1_i1.p1 TRINITY_DN8173_c0_g1~~TRINITY_DN8173_c0_g1_i1.p1  ORF type:complete len:624 (+),score=105.68 TRINITY_DN8173_c0_g1_i1:115-1986(+)